MALIYPSNLPKLVDEGAGAIMFTFYDRPNSQTATEKGSVQLYLPNNLKNPMDVNWTQTSNKQAVGSALETNDVMSAEGLKGLFKGLAIDAMVQGADFVNAKSITEQANRRIANPYIAMTFESIGFRKYNMEFRFTPHSGHESHLIDQIIKKFRKTALPSGGAFLGYPGEVHIKYVGNCN